MDRNAPLPPRRRRSPLAPAGIVLAVVLALAVVGGALFVGRAWWRAPSRWKDAATPPPGFEQALSEFDAGRTEAGVTALRRMRRSWTHPLWDRRAGLLEGYWSGRLQQLQAAAIGFELARGDAGVPAAPGRDVFCLAPYAAVSQAAFLLRLDRPADAARVLDPFIGTRDSLPWADQILETWARATGAAGRPADALKRIEEALAGENAREPEALRLLAAKLRQSADDPRGAAAELKRVYCEWPRTAEAERALEALAALPPPHRDWTQEDIPLLERRAKALAEAGDTAGAVAVWTLARDRIEGGAASPLVRARLGAALAAQGEDRKARALLQPLPSDPTAARIARLALAGLELDASRLTRAREIAGPLLAGSDAASRQEAALLLAQGADRLGKEVDALALYERALPLLPDSADRDQATWRAGWLAYRRKAYDRATSLFARLDRDGAHAGFRSASLYWTARAEQARRRDAEGQRLLKATLDRFRNDYYGLRAAERLGMSRRLPVRDRLVGPGPRNSSVPAASNGRPADSSAPLDPARFPVSARLAIAAGEELARLHLGTEASRALEFAARRSGERDLMLRLADIALQRGDRTGAQTWLRSAYPDLIRASAPGLPERHAEALYPIEHWDEIRTAAGRERVDPWLVCSVILQESGFNPLAVSRAGAVGLMQVVPETGRELVRQLGQGAWDRQRLFEPGLNVLVGTAYLDALVDRYDGRLEPALAAYNAGLGRADRWWAASGRDAERFVEDIPFTETRLYVKRIVSQWWMYRLLYEGAH